MKGWLLFGLKTFILIGFNFYEWNECCWIEDDLYFGDLLDEIPSLLRKIAEENVENLSRERFIKEYVIEGKPVVIRGATLGENALFAKVVRKRALVERFGDVVLTLSTANTQSYDKSSSTLREYVTEMMGPQDPKVRGCVFGFCSQQSNFFISISPMGLEKWL